MRKITQLIGLLLMSLSAILSLGLSSTQSTLSDVLSPDEPHKYLNVGEQRAALADQPQEVKVARQILAMGVVINDRQADPVDAASCAIALASTFAHDTREYMDLWDYALLLDPARQVQWTINRRRAGINQANLDAANALAYTRFDNGEKARSLFDQRDVRIAIREAAELVAADYSQLANEIRDDSDEASRDPCGGKYFDAVVEQGRSVYIICPVHSATLGTTKQVELFQSILATELVCLSGQAAIEDWGGAAAMQLTQPMHEPSQSWLIEEFQIDPSRPFFRNERWRASP